MVVSDGRGGLEFTVSHLSVTYIAKSNTSTRMLGRTSITRTSLIVTYASTSRYGVLDYLVTEGLNTERAVTHIHGPVCCHRVKLLGRSLRLDVTMGPRLVITSRVDELLLFPSTDRIRAFMGKHMRLVRLPITRKDDLTKLDLTRVCGQFRVHLLIYTIRRKSRIQVPSKRCEVHTKSHLRVTTSRGSLRTFFGTGKGHGSGVGGIVVYKTKEINCCLTLRLDALNVRIGVVRRGHREYRRLYRLLPGTAVVGKSTASRSLLMRRKVSRTSTFITLAKVSRRGVVLSLFTGDRGISGVIAGIGRSEHTHVMRSFKVSDVISIGATATSTVVDCIETHGGSRKDTGIRAVCRLISSGIRTLRFVIGTRAGCAKVPLGGLSLGPGGLVTYVTEGHRVVLPDKRSYVRMKSGIVVVAVRGQVRSVGSVLV